jgi:hypothetical protein
MIEPTGRAPKPDALSPQRVALAQAIIANVMSVRPANALPCPKA